MRIYVGSLNQVKVDAVREIIQDYPHLKHAKVYSIEVQSLVPDQPKSLDETVRGSMNRARAAFQDRMYSFGIESGIIDVPQAKTGYMEVCVCAIFDGTEYHLGLSSAWEAPRRVTDYMINEGLDMNQAAFKAGLTTNPAIGSAGGLIGLVTKGRLTRKEYTKQAIRTALIHLEP